MVYILSATQVRRVVPSCYHDHTLRPPVHLYNEGLFTQVPGETVWKMRPDMMMAYALRYGEQEIPHGSVRR